ncbi:MAG: redoxin domain-containing protein [Acidobacteria bacterium]|nr:redoxin domain-containing protein [Acidobacteriota bacterium]
MNPRNHTLGGKFQCGRVAAVIITTISLFIAFGAALVIAQEQKQGQKPDAPQEGKPMEQSKNKLFEGEVNAPDIPASLEWLNTEKPLNIRELRGKIVLLDFWTYCCINCMHIIPDLKKLEAKYANQLVVIGVHSAKFTTEKGTDNIRQAILRYEIEHPVVNDRDFEVWQQYGARSWPTLVLINPKGKVVGAHSGEGIFEPFDQIIGEMVAYFRAQGALDEKPINFKLEKFSAPPSLLSFPGKVLADEKSKRLFIADSNHNRIIITSLDGMVMDVIGDGAIGTKDGAFAEAEFNHPQGMALDGETLYICDTENHLIRIADLKARTVETLAGTGQQARRFNEAGVGTSVALNSPWDAVMHNGMLYIAMAGPHQLWVVNPKTREAKPYAGSGREDHTDGPLRQSALAQPSGITTDGKSLFFADSEVSSIRTASLSPNGSVGTIVGKGLFDYGDIDGVGDVVRLQHPLGVVYLRGKLYVADTYNHKVKIIDVEKRDLDTSFLPNDIQTARTQTPQKFESRTFAGTRERGTRDGDRKQAQFNEPGGISAITKALFVADTNNHIIRRIDLDSGKVSTVELKGLETLTKQMVRKFRGRVVDVSKQAIAPGQGTISLSFALPTGYKYNEGAPFYIAYRVSDDKAVMITDKETARNFTEPKFPFEIPIEAKQGESMATIEAVIYFCNDEKDKVCLVDSVRVNVPLEVKEGAPRLAKVEVAAKARGK